MTTVILWIMHFIPGLRLRASEEAEIVGIDDAYLGEFAYDYVGSDPELRLHRVGSKPTLSSGDVITESGRSHSLASTRSRPPKSAFGGVAHEGNAVAGADGWTSNPEGTELAVALFFQT